MKISELDRFSVGNWVVFHNGAGATKRGQIKSWNDTYIFVVFNCANDWDNFLDYTAAACRPEDLTTE